jgi:hypothetical protein
MSGAPAIQASTTLPFRASTAFAYAESFAQKDRVWELGRYILLHPDPARKSGETRDTRHVTSLEQASMQELNDYGLS